MHIKVDHNPSPLHDTPPAHQPGLRLSAVRECEVEEMCRALYSTHLAPAFDFEKKNTQRFLTDDEPKSVT